MSTHSTTSTEECGGALRIDAVIEQLLDAVMRDFDAGVIDKETYRRRACRLHEAHLDELGISPYGPRGIGAVLAARATRPS